MEIVIYWPFTDRELPPVLMGLSYPVVEEMREDAGVLIWEQDELIFAFEGERLRLDWPKWWYYHYQQRYQLSKEPLAKALGMKGHPGQTIWDLTCGLGKDSLLMLSFGAKVVAFERHPLIGKLLQNALERARTDQYLGKILKERFTLNLFDPLEHNMALPSPEVIYLDPMYTHKNSKAKPNLGMRLFREVVPEEDNLKQLFQWALARNPRRIVIKRAIHAPLMNPIPKVSYRGKSTRYDMYVTSEVADSN